MKKRFKILFIATITLTSSLSCQKISTPNEDSKKLFGSWLYDNNSGGLSGKGGSNRFSSGSWVEFTERGYFKYYINSKKESQKRFKIEMKKTIYDANLKPVIEYRNGDYDVFQISNDTLYLSDNNHDGYSYRFIKKMN